MKKNETNFTLTKGQRRALLHIKRGKNVFLSGGAGTGKSMVIQLAIDELQSLGKSVLVCAPTGIAALNVGGITIHRAFGFPAGICITDGGEKNNRPMSIMTRTTALVRGADTIIIDEISMVRMDLFDAVIASLTKIERKSNKKIQLVVVGDFYQLPPVLKNRTGEKLRLQEYYKKSIRSGYAFEGLYWDKYKFYPIILDEIIRQKDVAFSKTLDLARVGNPTCITFLNNACVDLDENPEEINRALHLYAHTKDVDQRNRTALNTLPGCACEYRTIIEPLEGRRLEDIDPLILKDIPNTLLLKEGARVIITANGYYGGKVAEEISSSYQHKANSESPLVNNGTFGTVYDIVPNASGFDMTHPVTVFLDNGRRIFLNPTTYPVYDYAIDPLTKKTIRIQVASYTQLPLQLAYAMTIHRAQGQTFDSIILDPTSFAPGQLYVGLSRTKTVKGLHLLRNISPRDLIVDPAVTAFYTSLGRSRMGRPIKNDDGSKRSFMIWVPKPLEAHVRREIEKNHPLKVNRLPAWKPGRVHMRVNAEMYEHISNEIAEWKKTVKKASK